jgi:predicted flap endonuclease-1-like 5' DNA nuclease
MMSAESTQYLVAAYADESAAKDVYEALLRARKENRYAIRYMAMLKRSAGGKVQIKESDDMYGGRGAGIGAVVGGAVGLLGGLPGIIVGAGVGALIAGVIAKRHDTGIPNEQLRELGAAIGPGDSAVVVAVNPAHAEEVAELLDQAAIRVTNLAVKADMTSPLFAIEELPIGEEQTAPERTAKTVVIPSPANNAEAESDDLQTIEGIGPTYAERLAAAGVLTFADLAALSTAEVMAKSKVRSETSAAAWIAAAKALT